MLGLEYLQGFIRSQPDREDLGRQGQSDIAVAVQLGLIYAVLATLSLLLADLNAGLIMIWSASPFLTYAAYRYQAKRRFLVPTAFVLSVATIQIVRGDALVDIVWFVAIDLILSFAGIQLLRRNLSERLDFDSPRQAAILIVAGGLLPAGLTMLGIHDGIAGDPRQSSGLAGWTGFFAVILGAAIILPMMLPAAAHKLGKWRASLSVTEGVGVIVLVAAMTATIVTQNAIPAMFLIFPVLMWSAIRFGSFTTGVAAACFSVAALLSNLPDVAAPRFLSQLANGERLLICQLVLFISISVPLTTAWLMASLRSANAKLRDSNSELNGVLRAMPDTLLLLDNQAVIQHCRSGQPCQPGLTSCARDGRHFLEILPTSAREAFADACQDVYCGRSVARFDYQTQRGQHQVFIEATVTQIFDDGYLVLLRDVTNQCQARIALRREAEMLARTNAELEQFAYVASHDLQEPLRTVVSFCELLQRRCAAELDDEGREFIQFAVDGSKRLQALINDLLLLSRVTTRAKPFVGTSLDKVVGDVCKQMQRQIDQTGARIDLVAQADVIADPNQLHDMFYHLIDNALKFRASDPPSVEIACQDLGDFWQITVRDNGIGFDAAFKERIFHIFQRLHTRDRYQGNGVGLALVRKIVDRHGGTVSAQSNDSQGSVFLLRLPKEPRQPAEIDRPDD